MFRLFWQQSTAVCLVLLFVSMTLAAEPIELPPPLEQASPDGERAASQLSGTARIFPAVLSECRRYGPVEEPEPEFYATRNSSEPGYNWTNAIAGSWGAGYGYPGYGYGGWGFGLAGYNRYYYRPWYTFPNQNVWSNRFPWYSPGGVGPNIYQPWYFSRNLLPWYSPYGIGPNIYTPTYQWQSYYPWYAPNGPGPNIYTPSGQYGGCLYW